MASYKYKQIIICYLNKKYILEIPDTYHLVYDVTFLLPVHRIPWNWVMDGQFYSIKILSSIMLKVIQLCLYDGNQYTYFNKI